MISNMKNELIIAQRCKLLRYQFLFLIKEKESNSKIVILGKSKLSNPFYVIIFNKRKRVWKSILFKVFYTLIDYLESLRLTARPINPIKLNPNAAVLEEFIPVLANSSDLAFAGLASSGFTDN